MGHLTHSLFPQGLHQHNWALSLSSVTHSLFAFAVTALKDIFDVLSSMLTSQTDSIFNWNGNYSLLNAETRDISYVTAFFS